jgi:hemolysin activation/secretion protein
MEKLSLALQNLNGFAFKETNGKINQVQSRAVKSNALTELMADFISAGFEVGKVQKGFIVRVPNEQLGSIVLGLDIQVKPLDYDFDSEVQAEKDRQAEIKARKDKKKKR